MYQALYRKWRPQTFDQVVGQKHITETLKNQVRTGRLSHAYIFIGTRGTGKTTCARILAKAVNCLEPVDGEPCGKCAACRGISEGSVMDVVELDAASNNGVDNVRALREEAVFSPTEVRKRVYIIDEVHMLSTAAFNALLKILEEPPEHLMFILATTELQKVPATILSRCQRHSFRRIETGEIASFLLKVAKAEGMELLPEAAEAIARLAEGGMRDALSLLDQCSAKERIDLEAVYSAMGLAGNRRIAQLLQLMIEGDCAAALKLFRELWMEGKDPNGLLGELCGLVRDALMVKVAPKGAMELISGSYDRETLEAIGARLEAEEMIALMDSLQARAAAMRNMKDPKIGAELCIASLCLEPGGDSTAALRGRIARLERAVATGKGIGGMAETAHEPKMKDEEALPLKPMTARTESRTHSAAPEMTRAAQQEQPEECPPWEETEELPREEPDLHEEEQEPWEDEDSPHVKDEGPGWLPARKIVGDPEEPDPVVFQEEQPEDSFLQGREQKTIKVQQGADQSLEQTRIWENFKEACLPKLPVDIQHLIEDESSVKPHLEGDMFQVQAAAGFVLGRLTRPQIENRLAEMIRSVAGRELRVKVLEMKAQQPRAVKDPMELKKFPEVRFI